MSLPTTSKPACCSAVASNNAVRMVTLCDGLLDHALVLLSYGIRKIVLRLHDAEDRPANRIAHVPLTETSFRVCNLRLEMVLRSANMVIHRCRPSFECGSKRRPCAHCDHDA